MTRILAALAAASVITLLAGCVPAPAVPEPPSAADVREFNQHQLDLTRTANELENSVRALTTSAVPATDATSPVDALLRCLTSQGIDEVLTWGTDGYRLGGSASTRIPLRQRIVLYRCVAENPRDPLADTSLVSVSERRYLYHYWTTWVIPCLQAAGYRLDDMPTEETFEGTYPVQFSPYDLVARPGPGGNEVSASGMNTFTAPLIAQCGEPYGLIARLNP